MIKPRRVGVRSPVRFERNVIQTLRHRVQPWGEKSGFAEDLSEGADVVCDDQPSEESGLNRRRTSSTEGVVDAVAGRGKMLDKELDQRRLEACPVRYLMKRRRGPLFRRPELG